VHTGLPVLTIGMADATAIVGSGEILRDVRSAQEVKDAAIEGALELVDVVDDWRVCSNEGLVLGRRGTCVPYDHVSRVSAGTE
jgi:hypothetical protein